MCDIPFSTYLLFQHTSTYSNIHPLTFRDFIITICIIIHFLFQLLWLVTVDTVLYRVVKMVRCSMKLLLLWLILSVFFLFRHWGQKKMPEHIQFISSSVHQFISSSLPLAELIRRSPLFLVCFHFILLCAIYIYIYTVYIYINKLFLIPNCFPCRGHGGVGSLY